MIFKIGIFGSSDGDFEKNIPAARRLGEILAKKNVILLTDACPGLPFEVVNTASKSGVEVWGFSHFTYSEDQQMQVSSDNSVYKKKFHIPPKYEFVSDYSVTKKYRNVTSTATCDAGIIISGRWGTLNEFTNLYDMGKVIGVLTGTGGIADELESLNKKIKKPGKAVVIFDNDPEKLVEKVLAELAKNK